MTPQAKYQRMILSQGFVEVSETNQSFSFFPQITFFDKELGRQLVCVDTSDQTAVNLLNALKLLQIDDINTVLSGERLMTSLNSGMTYCELWYKNYQLLIVYRGRPVRYDDALVVISKEDALGMISMITALH